MQLFYSMIGCDPTGYLLLHLISDLCFFFENFPPKSGRNLHTTYWQTPFGATLSMLIWTVWILGRLTRGNSAAQDETAFFGSIPVCRDLVILASPPRSTASPISHPPADYWSVAHLKVNVDRFYFPPSEIIYKCLFQFLGNLFPNLVLKLFYGSRNLALWVWVTVADFALLIHSAHSNTPGYESTSVNLTSFVIIFIILAIAAWFSLF